MSGPTTIPNGLGFPVTVTPEYLRQMAVYSGDARQDLLAAADEIERLKAERDAEAECRRVIMADANRLEAENAKLRDPWQSGVPEADGNYLLEMESGFGIWYMTDKFLDGRWFLQDYIRNHMKRYMPIPEGEK